MEIKIKGLNKLNANMYNRIIIREVDDNFFISVVGDKITDEYQSVSYKLSDNFKNMNAEDRVVLIVDSFLENSFINNIDLFSVCIGCSGPFIKIDGNRELYLQINNSDLKNKLLKMIIDKYNRDRYKYYINSDINNTYNIYFDRKETSYGKEFISCDKCIGCENEEYICPKMIKFKLLYMSGELVSFEKKFIEKFIYDKLNESSKEAYIYEETEDILVGGTAKVGISSKAICICSENMIIRFLCTAFTRKYIQELCNEIVNNYNKEIVMNDKLKKKQLKMEGF